MTFRNSQRSYRDLDTEAVDEELAMLRELDRRRAEKAIQAAYQGHERSAVICDYSSGLVRSTTRFGYKVEFILSKDTFRVIRLTVNPDDPSDDDSDGYFIYFKVY